MPSRTLPMQLSIRRFAPHPYVPVGSTARILGLTLAGGLAACAYEAPRDPLHYALNPKTITALEDADLYGSVDGTAAQIEGALALLVGTPATPQYLVLDSWEDFDPNYGEDELDEQALAEVRRDNERRFARELDLIRAGRYAEVPIPRYAADLWRRWQDGLADLIENPDAEAELGDGTKATRKEAAVDLFVHWYPTLAESASMYRQQCLHCHGTEGGGNGPTAAFLEPRPRDYRLGIFKWASTAYEHRPVRSDLLRILREGVNGTAMPPFTRFSRGELEGLVDYVRLLAVRGETETLMTVLAADAGKLSTETVLEAYDTVWGRWLEAEKSVTSVAGEVPREASAESIERGRQLFISAPANCYTCHGVGGNGDGESQYDDVAAKLRKLDKWGNPSQPRNFHQAILRGGSRPLDLYRRIKNGISGTIMPGADASLTDENIWDLVHFVQYLLEQSDVTRMLEAKLAHVSEASSHSEGHGGSSEGGH